MRTAAIRTTVMPPCGHTHLASPPPSPGGGGEAAAPSPAVRVARLRSRASATRLDRSEPFTILLTKGAASTLLGARQHGHQE